MRKQIAFSCLFLFFSSCYVTVNGRKVCMYNIIVNNWNRIAFGLGIVLIVVFSVAPVASLIFLALLVTGHVYLGRKEPMIGSKKPVNWALINKKHTYLLSNTWRAKRQQRLEIDNYTCQSVVCHSTSHLNIHHITYENLFNEPMEDLVTLCTKCHKALHKARGVTYDRTYPVITSIDELTI